MVYLKDVATIGLRYRPSFMSKETAMNMATALHLACSGILNSKSRLLGDIQVISDEQLKKMRVWNSRPSTDANELVHQMFEKQVSNWN